MKKLYINDSHFVTVDCKNTSRAHAPALLHSGQEKINVATDITTCALLYMAQCM